jgi:hypothetical protein
VLQCTDRDPLAGYCPISLRDAKRDIRYLDASDVQQLRDELLRVKLARWRYRAEGSDSPERLGFIIDDLAAGGMCQSPAVMPDGSHVDLYGYASLAVAAIQAQARQIDALEREVAALRAEMAARRP